MHLSLRENTSFKVGSDIYSYLLLCQYLHFIGTALRLVNPVTLYAKRTQKERKEKEKKKEKERRQKSLYLHRAGIEIHAAAL